MLLKRGENPRIIFLTELFKTIILNLQFRQSYVLQQDPTSNSLDTVFHALEYSWSLDPCECYVCDISFRPSVPNRNYTEYFLILDAYNCCYRLTVRGYCTGIFVYLISLKKTHFYLFFYFLLAWKIKTNFFVSQVQRLQVVYQDWSLLVKMIIVGARNVLN